MRNIIKIFGSGLAMEEKTLLRVSLATGVLGILLLYFISTGIDLPVVQKIDNLAEETEVKLSGIVGRVSDQDKVAFLEVLNEKIEKTDVILFKDREILLEKGDYVEIEGAVEDYKGKKEIIASQVVKK